MLFQVCLTYFLPQDTKRDLFDKYFGYSYLINQFNENKWCPKWQVWIMKKFWYFHWVNVSTVVHKSSLNGWFNNMTNMILKHTDSVIWLQWLVKSYGSYLWYFYGVFLQLETLDPIYYKCMQKNNQSHFQNVSFSFPLKKESHTDLEQHEVV